MAYDALEEVERIDNLVRDYDAALAAMRPRMEADSLNRDFSDVIARLRYNPDETWVKWRQEDMDAAVGAILAKKFRRTPALVS